MRGGETLRWIADAEGAGAVGKEAPARKEIDDERLTVVEDTLRVPGVVRHRTLAAGRDQVALWLLEAGGGEGDGDLATDDADRERLTAEAELASARTVGSVSPRAASAAAGVWGAGRSIFRRRRRRAEDLRHTMHRGTGGGGGLAGLGELRSTLRAAQLQQRAVSRDERVAAAAKHRE